jgi:hypothetical protein
LGSALKNGQGTVSEHQGRADQGRAGADQDGEPERHRAGGYQRAPAPQKRRGKRRDEGREDAQVLAGERQDVGAARPTEGVG